MGIEHFFNSIKKKYQGSKNIIKQLDIPPNNNKINSQNIYYDFNSVIHIISQRTVSDINILIDNFFKR